jgi:hypothetical protein
MAAAINSKRRRLEPARLPSPSSLWPYLSSCSNSYASLCLVSTPTHSLEHQFPSIAASGSRRRRREFVAAGEGKPPPPFFLSPWVHQGLVKLGLLHVLVPRARGSRASTTPERRPTHRRCQAPPPSHPLRFRARLLLFRTVSINPRPVSLLLAHFGALTSSPEWPLRPLPAPAAGEAQSPPLTPRSRAHASPLRFELSCGRVSGRERRPGAMPASSHRAPPARRRIPHAHVQGRQILSGRL